MGNPISRVTQALSDLTAGRAIVLVGSADDNPDGYLLLAAEKVIVNSVAFLVRHSSGFVCAAVTGRLCDRLALPTMNATNRFSDSNFYTVAVDAVEGVSTGISAADRARTLLKLAEPDSCPGDFTRPGHVVPARVHDEGVLKCRGPAEVITDLALAAGLQPVGAFAALVSEYDATRIANPDESREFASAHHLNWVSAEDVLIYRRLNEVQVRRTFTGTRTGPFGDLLTSGFHSETTGADYLAYHLGQGPSFASPWIHVHRESDFAFCATDIANPDLHSTFTLLAKHGSGIVLIERSTRGLESHRYTQVQLARTRAARNADVLQVIRTLGYSDPDLLRPPIDLLKTIESMGIRARIVPEPDSELGGLEKADFGMGPDPTISGVVLRGDQRGRKLGFPTANLEIDPETPVADGVWAGHCVLPDGRSQRAAISIGRRSTFYGQAGARLLEAHLLDFDEDMYDLRVIVRLENWIRAQLTFASQEDLVAALQDDVRHAEALLSPAPSSA